MVGPLRRLDYKTRYQTLTTEQLQTEITAALVASRDAVREASITGNEVPYALFLSNAGWDIAYILGAVLILAHRLEELESK